jgi:hypothetical protein
MNNPNAVTVALAKLIGEKTKKYVAARADLTPGVHNVDFAVQVRGNLTISADTDKVPTVSIPLKETLALFIAYSGITREHAINVLTRAMNDALAEGPEGAGAMLHIPVVTEAMQRVENEILPTLPRTPVKGMVRASLEYSEVSLTAQEA